MPEGDDLRRIGDKLVSRQRICRAVDRLLEARSRGLSQQEVAQLLGVDRSFVSRLEALGELRKGQRVAVVGFPVANKEALQQAAGAAGADMVLLMTNAERWRYARERSGDALFNELMALLSELKGFDRVIFLGSDMRIRLVEAILGTDRTISWELGPSPLNEDVWVDPERLASLVRDVSGKGR